MWQAHGGGEPTRWMGCGAASEEVAGSSGGGTAGRRAGGCRAAEAQPEVAADSCGRQEQSSSAVKAKWPRWFVPNCSSNPSSVVCFGGYMTPVEGCCRRV